MCVAIIIKGNHRPSLNDLQNMHAQNSDGAGVGWIGKTKKGKKVCRWVKGLNPAQVDSMLDKLPRPILVHFRFATVGGTKAELCHPFPVSLDMDAGVTGASQELLIHNGHWSGWDGWFDAFKKHLANPPAGIWSDTRMAAYLMALYPKERDAIADEVGGRVALLSAKDGHAWYWGHWVEEKEVMYSNTYWRTTRVSQRDMGNNYEEYANWYGYSSGESGYRYNSTKGYYKGDKGETKADHTTPGSIRRDGKTYKNFEEYTRDRPDRQLMANGGRGTTSSDFSDSADNPTEPGREVTSIASSSFRSETETAIEAVEAVNSGLAKEAQLEAQKAARKVVNAANRSIVEGGGTAVHQLVQVSKKDSQGVMRTWYELEPLGQAVTEHHDGA